MQNVRMVTSSSAWTDEEVDDIIRDWHAQRQKLPQTGNRQTRPILPDPWTHAVLNGFTR